MKISIEIDCSPEEARSFLGLPDVTPLQEAMMEEMEKRMTQAISDMEPAALLKNWFPPSFQGWEGWEQLQKSFWQKMAGAAQGGTSDRKGRETQD